MTNFAGEKCQYTQRATDDASVSYFFQNITGSDTLMVFDDPTCMHDDLEGWGLGYSQTTINNIITQWYVPGSAFLTRPEELYSSSILQIRGLCIQSSTYPTQAVLVEYFVDARHNLGAVAHQYAIQGCG